MNLFRVMSSDQGVRNPNEDKFSAQNGTQRGQRKGVGLVAERIRVFTEAENRHRWGWLEFGADPFEPAGSRRVLGPLGIGEHDVSRTIQEEIGFFGAITPEGKLPSADPSRKQAVEF